MINHRANNITHPAAWQSPVPYLFGGMAAMIGLIALALLILACSYRQLSGQFGEINSESLHHNSASLECGDKNNEASTEDTEEKVMVIMAGDQMPTFLAKPAMSTTRDNSL